MVQRCLLNGTKETNVEPVRQNMYRRQWGCVKISTKAEMPHLISITKAYLKNATKKQNGDHTKTGIKAK